MKLELWKRNLSIFMDRQLEMLSSFRRDQTQGKGTILICSSVWCCSKSFLCCSKFVLCCSKSVWWFSNHAVCCFKVLLFLLFLWC